MTVATAAATGAGIALPLLGATAAHAAGNGTWDKVAMCETGGLWSADTGNGFFGGLAITQTTWDEFGGGEYAARPDLASRSQQIAVAERILTDLGPDAWPGCEKQTGLLTDTSTPDVDPGTPSATPTLPGLPLPTQPDVPLPDDPSTTPPPSSTSPGAHRHTGDGTGTPDTPGGTAGATPTTPAAPGGTPTTAPTGTGTGSPGTSGTSAPPGTIDPGSTDPGSTDPGTTGTPPAGGRHAKPYSPTDEDLAAADRSTRTEVYGTTGRDATDAPGGTAGTTGNTGTTGSIPNKPGNSGTSDQRYYAVGPGDSLSGIAASRQVPGGWPALYDANRTLIGDNPNIIKPGQILNLG